LGAGYGPESEKKKNPRRGREGKKGCKGFSKRKPVARPKRGFQKTTVIKPTPSNTKGGKGSLARGERRKATDRKSRLPKRVVKFGASPNFPSKKKGGVERGGKGVRRMGGKKFGQAAKDSAPERPSSRRGGFLKNKKKKHST